MVTKLAPSLDGNKFQKVDSQAVTLLTRDEMAFTVPLERTRNSNSGSPRDCHAGRHDVTVDTVHAKELFLSAGAVAATTGALASDNRAKYGY